MSSSARAHSAHHVPSHMLAHRRLLICTAFGIVAGFIHWPGFDTVGQRSLIGWNVLVWLYLAWVAIGLARADKGHMRRLATAQAESAGIVLGIVIVAAIVSMVAVVSEIKEHTAFAFVTVTGSWLLLPTLFGLTYAATYFRQEPDSGLEFPGAPPGYEPDHTDILYFAFTIAVTCQTSDVNVTSREMRKLVLFQSVVSFVFNTTILAFSINAAVNNIN